MWSGECKRTLPYAWYPPLPNVLPYAWYPPLPKGHSSLRFIDCINTAKYKGSLREETLFDLWMAGLALRFVSPQEWKKARRASRPQSLRVWQCACVTSTIKTKPSKRRLFIWKRKKTTHGITCGSKFQELQTCNVPLISICLLLGIQNHSLTIFRLTKYHQDEWYLYIVFKHFGLL